MTYYAISIAELTAFMERAGFERARRLDDVFFQPVVVGVRPVPRGPARPPRPGT